METSKIKNFIKWWKEKTNKQKAIIILGLVILIGVINKLTENLFVTACDCANLYENQLNKEETPEQLDDSDYLNREVDNYIETAKTCAEKYGELSEMEKEIARTANSITWIPKLDIAIQNAKKECNK